METQLTYPQIKSEDYKKYIPVEYLQYSQLMNYRPELRTYPTFIPNKKLPIHSRYGYPQGFSKNLVDFCINQFTNSHKKIFDPFCGVGTTPITCFD